MMVAPPEARANVFTSSQRLLENHGLVRARKEPSSKNPHSLIISPNLDALLEFDRKVHGIQYPANTSPPLSAPPIQSEPDGLPLPPRRKARPTSQRSPTSPKISSPLAQEVIQKQEPAKEASANITIPNPFINSPPSLEMLAKVDDSITERDAQEPRDRQNLQALDDTTPDNDRQGTSENRGVRHQQTSSVNLPSATPVTVAHKSRVDKLLGIGKIPFGLFSESNDTSPATSPKSPKAPERSPAFQTAVPNLRERAKAKGKLLKPLKDPAMIDASQQSGFSRNDLVLDIRRDDSPVHFSRRTPDYRDQERGRSQSVEPYSHDNFFVPPSRPSLDSISSTSSSIAPSTDDSRISISSAIDLSSSGHSFTDMYHTPVIPPHRASSLYDSLYTPSFERRNSDRESFIDMVSPTIPEFAIPNRSDDIPLPKAPSRTSSPKPPLPTTPKPIFTRPPPRSSSAPRYEESIYPTGKLPPTTNFLDLDERSELVRKNRKIAQVLGQSPGPDALALPDVSVRAGRPLLLPSLSSNSHHVRGTLSLSNDYETSTSSSTPRLQTLTLDNTGRRHSSPLSPDFISHFSNIINHDRVKDEYGASSRESFIDLSDDLGSAALATPKDFGHGRPSSPSQQSIFENMTPEEQAEELRRRKREKLAKLHRFLGSRVPANLVLGLEDPDSSLPPTSSSVDFPSPMSASPTIETDDTARKAWVRRRRSSSAAIFSSTWSDEVDRIKEDLNAREKAVNVRRAQKMEKMFGVAPPQTLYHTRRSPSPSIGNALALASNKLVSGWTSPGENHPPVTGQRNPNRTSYTKPKKKEHRPGTSESSKALLPKNRHDSPGFDDAHRRFSVYSHYQESLNSLNDIIDRDDRESLAELHEYLNSGDMTLPPGVMARSGGGSGERRLSVASSVKSERRRSLPARTSMVSLASEYSASTPKPDVTDFQARRRRAAKLTQFFGVDYRELITDVLESIESGLEHERKRGTLNPDEVQDLQAKLRKLRVKREGIF